jgi:type II secretory pathway component GspD/PulD (secretin)
MIRFPFARHLHSRSARTVAAFAFFAFGLVSDTASGAPLGLPERPMDLELKEADIRAIFKLLGDVSQRELVLDPCVQGKVDVKLTNTPMPLVFDALALKLRLAYEDDGTAIHVRCSGDAVGGNGTRSSLDTRVSIEEKDAPLPEIARRLATTAKLSGVDYRAKTSPTVTMTLHEIRLSTAVTALGDASGLKLMVSGSRLVVTD